MSNVCAPNVVQSVSKVSKVPSKYYGKRKIPQLVKYFSCILTVCSTSLFVNVIILTVSLPTYEAYLFLKKAVVEIMLNASDGFLK